MIRSSLALILVAAPAIAFAQPAIEEEQPPPRWYDTVQVNGFASIAVSVNANRPPDDDNQLRVFDTDDGSINVDVIEVVVQKPATGPGQAGFRVDLTAGSTIPAATASAGLFRDADGNAQDVDLQQAFVSYVADVGRGLRLDAGKFVTHAGYELIEGYDGYNDTYSRSILFGYAIPFTHTGAKVSLPLTDQLSAMVMVVNGWDNVKDNNAGKTVGAQLGAVVGKASAWLNYVGGPEQATSNTNLRHLIDVVAIVKPVELITLGVNADLAYEDDGAADGPAIWMGAAGYARWDATPTVSLAGRTEVFRDRHGVRTGTPQTLFEATISPAVKLGDNVVLRGDLRFDRSNVASFMTHDGAAKQQVTVAINALGIL